MTRKNIFVYELLLSLNISDFSFFCKNCNPHPPPPPTPYKGHIPLSQQPPQKIGILSSPPLFFFENLVGGSTIDMKREPDLIATFTETCA